MNNENYYTPDVSDLFVGYECEIKNVASARENWVEHILTVGTLTAVFRLSNKNDVRTLYLTKEQIEKEGWEIDDEDWELIRANIGERLELAYFKEYHTIKILIFDEKMYHGKCPSINEFRKISKLLGI